LLLTAQSAYSASLMLYAWQGEDQHIRSRAPETFEPPELSFTILLPARHEEAVIQDTIQRVVDLDYPHELVQVLIVIEAGDSGTIEKVNQKLAYLAARGITHARLLTFADPPINKPHGLNVGLQEATGNVVTIFDAEDEPHPNILKMVNTLMTREHAPVVQSGVQLMNYSDRWFSALNVLEYFFWFKSRMHYHSAIGMVPLGGNTVFVERDLLRKMGGWDQQCLTEDADIGIRLSNQNVPIRVVYDDEYVTREETPPTVNQFIKQRTRWNQGFLQVLGKGDWLKLPSIPQRLLALYTLCSPLIQAVLTIYPLISLWMLFFVKLPTPLAVLTMLPLYMLVIQLVISLVGLYEFTSAHGLKPSLFSPIRLLFSFLPYQGLLGYAALRAVFRQLRGMNSWEKTVHIGAHRTTELTKDVSTALPPVIHISKVDEEVVRG
jgi:cellulose synthase/poly-beta-1,6-N-acetylglucosamine synthase-like glycosyltransferase